MSKRSKARWQQQNAVSPRAVVDALATATHEDQRPVASVSVSKDAITVPIGGDLSQVIAMLQSIHRDRECGNEDVQIKRGLPVLPLDGAWALSRAIKQRYGMFVQLPDSWGNRTQYEVRAAHGNSISIPWGNFDFPGTAGYVATGAKTERGTSTFICTFVCRRKFADRADELIEIARSILERESIYRGQAFIFPDGERDPVFFSLVEEQPIYTDEVQAAIERNVVMPLRHVAALTRGGKAFKRGVVLGGKYGVGKTLFASYAARLATSLGWTFIYVKDASKLPQALVFAQQYQPVVVFAEDIDRVAGPDRTDQVDELMKQIDGIDGKDVRMMTLLTTNHPERINLGMLRPGRIDAMVLVTPPDAVAIERILHVFGKGRVASGTDLTDAAFLLEGESPARVREALTRAELETLRRTGNPSTLITGEDLRMIALEMQAERQHFGSAASQVVHRVNGAATK